MTWVDVSYLKETTVERVQADPLPEYVGVFFDKYYSVLMVLLIFSFYVSENGDL